MELFDYMLGVEQGKKSAPQPSGTIEITENGTYDVSTYEEADVNVESGKLDHTVTFTVDGNDYTKISVADGVKVPEPVEPEVESGRLFKNWKDGDDVVEFPYTPQTDKTFIAYIIEDLVSVLYNHYSIDRTAYQYVFIWRDASANYTYIYFTNSYSSGSSISVPGNRWEGFTQKFVDDPSNISSVVDLVTRNITVKKNSSGGVGGVGSDSSDYIYTNLPVSTFAGIPASVYQI